jgi:L-rhamnose mutarotase
MEVIFNFSRYEELRQAVIQLLQENIDSELLYEEAEDLFDCWWNSQQASASLTEERKQQAWQALTAEFGQLAR